MILSTIELLDRAKARQGGISDYRLAKRLDITPSTVSNYRVGRSKPENPIAARLAALCELDAERVVLWVNLERASSEEERGVWRSLLAKVERLHRAEHAASTASTRQIVAGEKSARQVATQALARVGAKVKPVHNRAR